MLADRSHRRACLGRLMAAAQLRRTLSTLGLGECTLSRVSCSGIHIIAGVARHARSNSSGSAVRHGKYFAALSGTGAKPFRRHNRTAVDISIESNSWTLAARNLFWISAVSFL